MFRQLYSVVPFSFYLVFIFFLILVSRNLTIMIIQFELGFICNSKYIFAQFTFKATRLRSDGLTTNTLLHSIYTWTQYIILTRKYNQHLIHITSISERRGFEPLIHKRVCRISNAIPSATRSPFLIWGRRIRTSEWRDQNPMPYHLAMPQFVLIIL